MTTHVGVAIVGALLLATGTPGPVTVLVSATTPDHQVVTGLSIDDFVVEVDGQRVVLDAVFPTAGRLSVALLVDRSPSMKRYPPLAFGAAARLERERLQRAENLLLRGVFGTLGETDTVFVGTLKGAPHWLGPLSHTSDAFRALGVFFTTPEAGSSPIWDAVASAIPVVRQVEGRPIVVLVTDGKANANRLSVEEAAEQLIAAGVTVSIVQDGPVQPIRQLDKMAATLHPDRALRWLAEATGGHFFRGSEKFEPDNAGVTDERVAQALQLQRQKYSIQFTPPIGTGRAAIRVSVRRPGVVVSAPAFITAQ